MKTYQVTIGYYTRQVTKEFTTTVEALSKSAALGEAVHQLLADGYAIIGLEYIDIKKIRSEPKNNFVETTYDPGPDTKPFSERLAEMEAMFERDVDTTPRYMWGDLT